MKPTRISDTHNDLRRYRLRLPSRNNVEASRGRCGIFARNFPQIPDGQSQTPSKYDPFTSEAIYISTKNTADHCAKTSRKIYSKFEQQKTVTHFAAADPNWNRPTDGRGTCQMVRRDNSNK